MLSATVLRRTFTALRTLDGRGLTLLSQLCKSTTRLSAVTAVRMPARAEFGPVRTLATQTETSASELDTDAEVELPPSLVETTPISKFDLSPSVATALETAGFKTLFPVQAQTLPFALEGRDVIVRARTGTGKTLGFVIPVVEYCVRNNAAARSPRTRLPLCLVMTPTRELAVQVEGEFKKLTQQLRLRSVCVYGGASYTPQRDALNNGVDVVVGTPGRIMDMLNSGDLKLSSVRFAVLDEADDMLKRGFKEDVENIYTNLPQDVTVHHMLWSATVPSWVQRLGESWMNQPKFIDLVGHDGTKFPETLAHYAVPVARGHESPALKGVLEYFAGDSTGRKRALIFTETKAEASGLSTAITTVSDIKSAALTGDMSQAIRERTLRDFRNGRIRCLIATDVAARGLDIPDVELVVHSGPPRHVDSFVHRSGRTARAGKSGTSVVIFDPQSRDHHQGMKELEEELGFKFGLTPVPKRVASKVEMDVAVRDAIVAGQSKVNIGNEADVHAAIDALTTSLTQEQLAKAVLKLAMRYDEHVPFSFLTGRPGHATIRIPSNDSLARVLEQSVQRLGREHVHHVIPSKRGYYLADVSAEKLQEAVEALKGTHMSHGDIDEDEVAIVRQHIARKHSRYSEDRGSSTGRDRDSFSSFRGRDRGYGGRDDRGYGGRDNRSFSLPPRRDSAPYDKGDGGYRSGRGFERDSRTLVERSRPFTRAGGWVDSNDLSFRKDKHRGGDFTGRRKFGREDDAVVDEDDGFGGELDPSRGGFKGKGFGRGFGKGKSQADFEVVESDEFAPPTRPNKSGGGNGSTEWGRLTDFMQEVKEKEVNGKKATATTKFL